MEPEVRHLLEENIELPKENKFLLVKIYNYQKWTRISKVIYLLLIIGVSLGAFHFAKPYIGDVLGAYSSGLLDN